MPTSDCTRTFLFTDIEGSTRLWDEHPEAMPQAPARHDEILRTAIEGNGGVVFKTVGDAFYGAFTQAPAAVRAALEAQRGLGAAEWTSFGETVQVMLSSAGNMITTFEGRMMRRGPLNSL